MSTTPPLPPTPPPGPAPQGGSYAPSSPAAKKGLSPLAWVAIGCGALLLLSGVAFIVGSFWVAKKAKNFAEGVADNPALATAKMIDFANPDIELVSHDDAAKTVTFRSVKDDRTFTFSWEDIEQGRFSISDDSGQSTTFGVDEETGTAGMVVRDESGEVTQRVGTGGAQEPPSWLPVPDGVTQEGGWVSDTPQGTSGLLTYRYSGSREEILDFYRTRLEAEGFELENSSYRAGDTAGLDVIVAKKDAQGRSASISLGGEVGTFAVTFESPKAQ